MRCCDTQTNREKKQIVDIVRELQLQCLSVATKNCTFAVAQTHFVRSQLCFCSNKNDGKHFFQQQQNRSSRFYSSTPAAGKTLGDCSEKKHLSAAANSYSHCQHSMAVLLSIAQIALTTWRLRYFFCYFVMFFFFAGWTV